MTDTYTRTLLERACAKAVDVMLSGDDVATVRQATSHHVVIIRTVESDEREARTIQRREEHAENARADTERELARVVDELAHVREMGAAELARASDDLIGAAAEVDALRAEVARLTGIAVDHCARADAAERALDEVGIQLAAAQERIKLLEQVAKEARAVLEDHDRSMIHLDDAVSALDAVPGDALAPRITAALEASGIDTSNVKGVE